MTAPAITGILPREDEPLAVGGGELGEFAEIGVIPLPLAGQQGVQGMVEVVVPLGIEAVAAALGRGNGAHVVEIALGDDLHPPPQGPRLAVNRRGQLLQDVPGAEIEDAVDGIEAQGVDVVLASPRRGRC